MTQEKTTPDKHVVRARLDRERWRPVDGEEWPETGDRIRVWLVFRNNVEREFEDRSFTTFSDCPYYTDAVVTHWRPAAKGPGNDPKISDGSGGETTSFLMRVANERSRQREIWGNAHDDLHNGWEWGGILAMYVGRFIDTDNPDDAIDRLVKIAAIATACGEALIRREGGDDE